MRSGSGGRAATRSVLAESLHDQRRALTCAVVLVPAVPVLARRATVVAH
jgi:hypothetical protein